MNKNKGHTSAKKASGKSNGKKSTPYRSSVNINNGNNAKKPPNKNASPQYANQQQQYRGNTQQFTNQQQQYRGNTQQFTNQQKQYRGNTQQFTNQQKQYRGNTQQFTNQQKQYRGNTQQFTNQQQQYRGNTQQFTNQQKQYRGNTHQQQQYQYSARLKPKKKSPEKKSPPKPKLTPQQKEQIREQKKFLKQVRREAFIRRMKIWLKVLAFRSIVVLILAVIMSLIYAGIFTLNLHSTHGSKSYEYTCYVGIAEDQYSEKVVSDSLILSNGSYYVNMNDIVSYCSLITTGDVDEMRYILKRDTDENVRFTIGSSEAYVNGVLADLGAKVIKRGDNLYVPISFFDRFVIGIEVEIDETAHTVRFHRTLTADSAAQVNNYNLLLNDDDKTNNISLDDVLIEYIDMDFRLRKPESNLPISESSLDPDILLATDPTYLASLAAEALEAASDEGSQTEP